MPFLWRLLGAIALFGAGGAAVVTSGGDNGASAEGRAEAVRTCLSRIEGRQLRPNRRDDFVAGPVILYGLREASRSALRHPSEAFQTKDREYAPLKTIAEVRGN